MTAWSPFLLCPCRRDTISHDGVGLGSLLTPSTISGFCLDAPTLLDALNE